MKKQYYLLLIILFPIAMSGQQGNANCKCCTEMHQQFDFWIGTWTVTNPNGSAAGENTIKHIQDKCVLEENWKSAKGGYTGTSHSFYNQRTKQWEQVWIDNQGGSLHLKGYRKDNQMILKTDEATNKEGKSFFHRVTWTKNEDGTVRQLWETITNDKDITIAFDGLYKKID